MSLEFLKESRILLVEDQLIIAMDVEFMLSDHGVAATDTATSSTEAFEVLATVRPDAALLDFNLGQETSLPIADHLFENGIPFVFATGYGDNSMIPEKFSHVPIVSKPYDVNTLIATLSDAMAGVRRSS
jgi:CheY-like chemotaxis protein